MITDKLGRTYKNREPCYGIGIYDISSPSNCNNEIKSAYNNWRRILERCYSTAYKRENPTYEGCYVCEEWKLFSNFLEWHKKNFIDGYQLDKDIIKKGNKCYCKEYCCFVPPEINRLLIKRNAKRGKYPIGVSRCGKNIMAFIHSNGKVNSLGCFRTIEEAFYAYKTGKERWIKEISSKYYKDAKITERVYTALQNYKVEITD